jgi:beta-lactam-binding protein with PASTA domain
MAGGKKGKNYFLGFLISKRFFKNLGIAVILMMILIFTAIKFLDIYTEHGEEVELPDFKDMTVMQIDSAGYGAGFDFFIIDSVYDESKPGGTVVMQLPHSGTMVKKGRNVYLTVVAMTQELVIMPDLKDLTLRQAVNVLESGKLQVGKLKYVPSFDKNAVLEQMFEGDTIFPGDTLVKGSVIDLVVGSGDRTYEIPVPFLIGKTREEAIYSINTASFNLGHEIYLDSIVDEEHSKVYMQDPRWDTKLSYYPGDSIHLWYRSDDSVDFELYLQTFLPDSLRTDTLAVDTLFKKVE